MNHKNLRNFATTKQLNCRQICWTESLADFEFQIHYKKDNENDRTDILSRQSDHEGVEQVHIEILSEHDKILMKELAMTYKIENALLTDKELIRECHTDRAHEHLEVKCTENLV